MQNIALLPRVLGSLFYYSPTQTPIYQMIAGLDGVVRLFAWHDPAEVEQILQNLLIPEQEELGYQFSVLFEGQGEMVAPPWGAVYQDRDGLLMAESTLRYRAFLAEQQLVFTAAINEPEDQFGLMLLALAQLLEQEKLVAAQILLEQHLFPWSSRYLQLLAQNDVSPFYAALARIASLFLAELSSSANR